MENFTEITVRGSGRKVKVIDRKPSHDGSYIVLCQGWNDVTPFVVWRYWPTTGDLYSGDYCETLVGALRNFRARK